MLNFSIGFTCGLASMAFMSWLAIRSEWKVRVQLDNRVKYLERHLCCGAGVFGCSGGRNCTFDHK